MKVLKLGLLSSRHICKSGHTTDSYVVDLDGDLKPCVRLTLWGLFVQCETAVSCNGIGE